MNIYLIYIHAEASARLLKLFTQDGALHTPARLALKGIAMALSVKFEGAPTVHVEEVKDEVDPEVQTYDFNGMSLRVVTINGEPWFVASDALDGMGYPKGSRTMIVKKLNDDERAKANLAQRGLGSVNIISESGLNKLITRSDKAEAKPFQEWVTRDVLPSIRKTGSYSMTDGPVEQAPEPKPVKTIPALTGEVMLPELTLTPPHSTL